MDDQPRTKQRLAIVGGGSSGLISLKYALDTLPTWEVVCYEKSHDIRGCWGRPPRGFVSTSTKYATQFACYRKFNATVADRSPTGHNTERAPEFFCDGEYGDYLESFSREFGLDSHVRRLHRVDRIVKDEVGRWSLNIVHKGREFTESFDALIICTGLADQPRPLPNCAVPTLDSIDEAASITNRRIVVMGGGESAVDLAQRLAREESNNEVYLSLRSGVRVSPRYHPIRGVPSDFLRNRLMLSIHPDLRNWIGQKFVEFRIHSQETLQWLFPQRQPAATSDIEQVARRKQWDLRLTRAAKDQLFNMYHNKSDDFLNDVAAGRIQVIGANVDDDYKTYFDFDSSKQSTINPQLIVPAIGYRSTLADIFDGQISLSDFYLGSCHVHDDDVYLVGFTRPIIGNIPSISEMQARFVCHQLAGQSSLPTDVAACHRRNRADLETRYPNLDTVNVYPVEMFPYCDQLARLLGCYPSRKRAGSIRRWWRLMLAPATTMHYFEDELTTCTSRETPIHAPSLITLLLLIIKPLDFIYRLFHRG